MTVATAPAPTIRRRPKRASEFDTREIKPNQRPTLTMPPITESVVREPEITIAEGPLTKKDFDVMAFNEEPVTILIHKSGEKHAPPCTDLISINGKFAEMMFKNGWVPFGYLPRGRQITVKRKYVEALARAKYDVIETKSPRVGDDESVKNTVERNTIASCTFTVIEDKNPLGVEWLSQLLRMN